MRAREFLPEDAASATTTSGSMATVSRPLGGMISRQGLAKPAKYANSLAPVNKWKRRHVSG